MTIELLRENVAFREGWDNVWPGLRAFLIARTLAKARGGKCVIETSQAESAVQRELSTLIGELETIGISVTEQPTVPTMKPLHSMSDEP